MSMSAVLKIPTSNNISDDLQLVPLANIKVVDGFNPRKFFDDSEFRDLVGSIKEHGVAQPILIRKADTTDEQLYFVVAGERRYRAAIEAGLEVIPALIKGMDVGEAKLLAIIENSHRANISIAEEAVAARDALTLNNNDLEATLRQLVWSKAKFDARILLLHADPQVLDALTTRKIKVGHAELLSQLPSEFQLATLEKILEHHYSVSDLKTRLAGFALDLGTASFVTTECNTCPHNSALQASLFDEHIVDGRCAKHDCFNAKTQAALEEKKNELRNQYSVVFLDTERSKDSFKVVCQLGVDGVGKSQFEKGCKQCAHFGALLDTTPGHSGRITEDCCFNLECHKDKVVVFHKSIKTPAKTVATNTTTSPAKTKGIASSKSSEQSKSNEAEKTAVPSTVPNAVVEKIEGFYRQLAGRVVLNDKKAMLSLNTFALFRLVRSSNIKNLWPDAVKNHTDGILNLDSFLKLMAKLDISEIVGFNQRLLCHLLVQHENSQPLNNKVWALGGCEVVGMLGVNLQQQFELNQDFLMAFTKAGIESILKEAVNKHGERFEDFYNQLDKTNSIAKLMKMKNKEILTEVFDCGFDFTGFVPRCVSGFVSDDKGTKPDLI